MNILIVEDDEILRKTINTSLALEEYNVFDTGDPVEGMNILIKNNIDLVLLDWGLPKIDGLNFCKIVRGQKEKYGNPYIIILTAKSNEEDVVKGLDAGADDYIKKPFNGKELSARIKAVSRRSVKPKVQKIVYKVIEIDIEKKEVWDNEKKQNVEMTFPEFEILRLLIEANGNVVTRETISREALNREYDPGNRLIDNYISRLKDKIEILENGIISVRTMGYRITN